MHVTDVQILSHLSNRSWTFNFAFISLVNWVPAKHDVIGPSIPALLFSNRISLTHCGLVTPYGDRDLGMACSLTAPSHYQESMLTDHKWSPMTFILGQFHKRCLSQPSITKIYFKITYKKFHSNFPGANELRIKEKLCRSALLLIVLPLWLQNFGAGRKDNCVTEGKIADRRLILNWFLTH